MYPLHPLNLPVVAELGGCTNPLTGPDPLAGVVDQLIDDHMPLTVEEVRGVLAALTVIADDLHAADVEIADVPVRGVQDRESAGDPFVHIAGHDLGFWRFGCGQGVAL